MLNLVNKASTIINTAGTVIVGLFGGGMELGNFGGALTATPLPQAPYSSPGA
jgi:hypothetical protein